VKQKGFVRATQPPLPSYIDFITIALPTTEAAETIPAILSGLPDVEVEI